MVPKHHRREQQAKQPEAVVVGRKPVGGIRKCRRIRDAGGLWRPQHVGGIESIRNCDRYFRFHCAAPTSFSVSRSSTISCIGIPINPVLTLVECDFNNTASCSHWWITWSLCEPSATATVTE